MSPIVRWQWTAIAWLAGWLAWLLWQPFRGFGLLLWLAVQGVVILFIIAWDAMLEHWTIALPVAGLCLVAILLWVPPWEPHNMGDRMALNWPYALGTVSVLVAAASFTGGFLLVRLFALRKSKRSYA